MTDMQSRLAAALADRYRLDRELGAGGMATVYLAHDLKHERKVAIKVLRPELSAVIGAERFLREIKTIAGLQHPHILGLIDSGELDGTAFYVMPYVEGESLRDRLQREKQLPIAEAVRLTSEVASALDYAHRRGVIHRDIKPENILLHDGSALVADFGIALAMTSAGGTRMTETGMSLGTPTYMSPEQAMGEREITARSDVYALGCVLYEMLVGEPPFTGPTAQAIVAKVMTDEPRPPSQLRRTVPAALERVNLTALAKLPADRYATAAAMLEALTGASLEPGSQSALARSSRAPASILPRAMLAVLCVALGAAGATVALRPWQRASTGGGEVREQATFSGRAQYPAISADGRFLAYLESRCPVPPTVGGCWSLLVVEVGGTRPVELVNGAASLLAPRWTHDGLAVVFSGALDATRSGLFIVPRLGGTARRLADLPVLFDTHASADSVALVVPNGSGAALEVRDLGSGRASEARVSLAAVPLSLSWSPDGQRFAWTTIDSLLLVSRDGRAQSATEWKLMRPQVRWSANGRAVLGFQWTAGSTDNLVAVSVNGDGVLGARRQLSSLLFTQYGGAFDVARTSGRIVAGSGSEFTDIWGFDLSASPAKAEQLTQGSSWFGHPALAANGRTVWYLRADPLGNSLYGLTDGRETALTAEPQVTDNFVHFSPDGGQVSWESYTGDTGAVFAVLDVATGATRYLPRTASDFGLLLPAGGGIVWINENTGRLWITDANGRGRRDVTARAVASFAGGRILTLSPRGDAVVVLTSTAAGQVVEILPLSGERARTLATVPMANGRHGVAAWAPDDVIYLARQSAGESTTLVGVDAVSGASRPGFVLSKPCDPQTVSFVPAIRRAVCRVTDRRSDLVLMNGIRP